MSAKTLFVTVGWGSLLLGLALLVAGGSTVSPPLSVSGAILFFVGVALVMFTPFFKQEDK